MRRKGSQTLEVPVWLIVVLFAAIIFIFLQTEAARKAIGILPGFKECTEIGGKCAAVSDCSQLTDNTYLTSTEKCEGKNEICCIKDRSSPYYIPPKDDDTCSGKKEGDTCAVRKVCMKHEIEGNLVCEEKCLFCSKNPDNAICKVTAANIIGKSITKMDNDFKCGCTSAECKPGSDHTCVKLMCSSTVTTASDYMCCDK